MLRIDDLTVSYGKKVVIDALSFDFEAGKTYAITGLSGIGKTTLLNVISGLISSYSGNVVNTFKKTAFIFQEPRLFPWMSALENVLTVCDNKERAEELLIRLLGDRDTLKKYPSELSGGMRSRVSIARALSYEPDLLLMDEPFKGLDKETYKDVSSFVFDFIKERGLTALIVTHDERDLAYCDNVLSIKGSPASELILEKSSNA